MFPREMINPTPTTEANPRRSHLEVMEHFNGHTQSLISIFNFNLDLSNTWSTSHGSDCNKLLRGKLSKLHQMYRDGWHLNGSMSVTWFDKVIGKLYCVYDWMIWSFYNWYPTTRQADRQKGRFLLYVQQIVIQTGSLGDLVEVLPIIEMSQA